MGVPLPDPSKKETQFNNRKVTYSKICRDKLFELGREMGLELIEEPREKGRSGRELDEVKTEGIRKDFEEAQRQAQTAQKQLKEVKGELREAQMDLTVLAFDQEQAERVLESTQNKIDQKKDELSEVQSQTEDAQQQSQAAAQELTALLRQLEGAKKIATFYKTPDGKAVHDFLMEYYPDVLVAFYEEQEREDKRHQETVKKTLENLSTGKTWQPPSKAEQAKKKSKPKKKNPMSIEVELD